jgi:beta-glucuronidase
VRLSDKLKVKTFQDAVMNLKFVVPSSAFCAILCLFCVGTTCFVPEVYASNTAKPAAGQSLDAMLRECWAASNKDDYGQLETAVKAILAQYEQQAMSLSSSLSAFPARDKMADYQIMNSVATAQFVQAEAVMKQGRSDDAVKAFTQLMKDYPYAQSWDASRGSYWSIREKSQESINSIKGVDNAAVIKNVPATKPVLEQPGDGDVVDYNRYGEFVGIGTDSYVYKMKGSAVLAKAVGEGIYPNTMGVLKNRKYKEVFKQGRLNGTHWDFVNTRDLEAAYFKWATAPEEPGVKLFYTALILERSGLLMDAVKAYHALVVFFPRSVGITYWHTPWYPAQAAIGKIKNILRQNPQLGYEYVGGKIQIINSNDNDTKNDVFIVSPGVVQKALGGRDLRRKFGKIVRTLGGKAVKIVQYASGDWQLLVNGKPYLIKGITYVPTKVGQSPDKGTVENWMTQDTDHNGQVDSPYDSWVDKNRNGIQDADEPAVGDFQLMKDMGVNTIRLYHHPSPILKEVLRDMYKRTGIMVVMSDFLGKYTIGSGADWASGTDYENPVHQETMLRSVEAMVNEFRGEPYILMWLLGNENNYGVASNGDKKPDIYYAFLNKVAKRVKALDPTRPVAMCNGDTLYLDKFAKNAPDVDVFGSNVYRGDYGVGAFWDEVRRITGKPAIITEYGAPAFSSTVNEADVEDQQAAYHRGSWMDIESNSAGYSDGEGNALGGIAFEWMDEWWKNYEPAKHDTKADVIGPFAGGYYFEEWFGIVGQGNGEKSPFLRQLRKAYYTYKQMWTK